MKRRAVADPVNLACKKLLSTIDDISELVAAISIPWSNEESFVLVV